MTTPTKLVFREWRKPEVNFKLHDWRPDKSLAFVIDDKGRPQVLELGPPTEINEHDRLTAAFGQSPPTDITEIRLVAPPCRTDQAEAHTLHVLAKKNSDGAGEVFPSTSWQPSRWEWVRLGYDSEILIFKPDDDTQIGELLLKFKVEKRREFDERKQEIHDLSDVLRRGQITFGRPRYYAHLIPDIVEAQTIGAAQANLYFLNQECIRLDMEFGQGGYKSGYLQWTLDDARRHHHIRDLFLQSRWAKENGLDLQEMAAQRKQIAVWTGLGDFVEAREKPQRELFGTSSARRAPNPTTLEMANADELMFGASIRFSVTFADGGQKAWLTTCRRRAPEPHERSAFGAAQATIVTLETLKAGHGQVLTKLDSVEKKTDQVLSGVQTLTELAGEQATTREQWCENPLGSRQAVADYLLTMDSMKIQCRIAAALVRFGYGDSRKQCADAAGVSEATIKRALKLARQTPYAHFFARTRSQRINARAAMKKPDEAYAILRQLAETDPNKLRALTEQMIVKAQSSGETDKGNAWDQTVNGLS